MQADMVLNMELRILYLDSQAADVKTESQCLS